MYVRAGVRACVGTHGEVRQPSESRLSEITSGTALKERILYRILYEAYPIPYRGKSTDLVAIHICLYEL